MKKYRIVTIERQFASGGRQVGSMVAEQLGISVYNEEILRMAASKLNIPAEYVQPAEEAASSSLMYALSMLGSPESFTIDMQMAERLFYEESQIIGNLAQSESCVIVGRCAGHVLSERTDCLRVFIYADEDARIKRAVEEYGIPQKEARSALNKNDKRRTGFYNAHSERKWASMDTYDLCLNSETLGLEGCAKIIAAAMAE